MKLFDVSNRRVLVTGAAQGLGLGVAQGFLDAGARVGLIDINPAVMQIADQMAAEGHDAFPVVMDVRDDSARDTGFTEAVERLGGLDVLVTAAGVQRRYPSAEFPLNEWDFVMDVNLRSVFALCQAAGQQFMRQGTGGSIINFASMLSFFGGYTVPAYAASKGGIAQLTKALANEWASKNIIVNAVAPGYMATEMNAALLDEASPRYIEITNRIPALRWGTAEDMVGPVLFLASDAARYLSGAVIPVDGGYLAR